MLFYSAKINDTHMKDRYGMVLSEMHYASPPQPKIQTVSIPGTNGALDLTEVHGEISYENRKVTMMFGALEEKEKWPSLYSKILNDFNGKWVRVIFDDDPNYYYIGRAVINSYERFQQLGKLQIVVDADPYKYDIDDGSGEWLWDSFSFVDGIIREYSNVSISGTGKIIIAGRKKKEIPIITCSKPMVVTCDGITVNLPEGITKVYDLQLGEGMHELIFSGNGIVSISYRGGIL